MKDARIYLGDGLYGYCDSYGALTLTTERGDGEHYVVLEPHVLAAFEAWVRELRADINTRAAKEGR